MSNEICDFFNSVGKWGVATFPDATWSSILDHLKDEIIEVELELSGRGNGALGVELADCYLLLIHLAERNGIRMVDVVGPVEDLLEPGPSDSGRNGGMDEPGGGAHQGNMLKSFEDSINHLRCGFSLGEAVNLVELMRPCLRLLFLIAATHGVRLLEEAKAKFRVNQNRRWGVPDGRGVVRHLE